MRRLLLVLSTALVSCEGPADSMDFDRQRVPIFERSAEIEPPPPRRPASGR